MLTVRKLLLVTGIMLTVYMLFLCFMYVGWILIEPRIGPWGTYYVFPISVTLGTGDQRLSFLVNTIVMACVAVWGLWGLAHILKR